MPDDTKQPEEVRRVTPLPIHITTGHAALTKAVVGVMRRVKEVQKTGWNKEGKYEFLDRGDVLASVQDALVQESLVIFQREVSRVIINKILFITYEFDLYHEGEALLCAMVVTGSCRFEFKAGGTDDKSAAKCFSVAEKRCLLGLFRIPPADMRDEDEDDPDYRGRDDDGRDRGRQDRRRGDDGRRGGDDRRDRRTDDSRDEDRRDGDRRDPPRDDDRRAASNGDGRPDDVFPDRTREAQPPAGGNGHDTGAAAGDFKIRVQEFGRKLNAATTQRDADLIWGDHRELIQQLSDPTYDHFAEGYYGRWRESPPKA